MGYFGAVRLRDGRFLATRALERFNALNFHAFPGGNGVEEPLLESPGTTIATSWSSDGRFVLYSQLNPQTGFDLWALPLFGDRKPLPVVATASDEGGGQFSKDMRWIAYESNESGRFEIVVQPFMNAGGKLQISTGGGMAPRWRADGKELFYVAPDRTLMGVPIAVSKDGKSLEPGNPVPLVPARTFPTGYTGPTKPPYDVTPDGQRFLMLVPGEEANPPITVLLNWRSPAR